MKRIAVIAGLCLGLLVLLALVGPALVPWNEFRSRVADGLTELTGRQVVIDGDLDLSLLPAPTLRAGSVRLLDDGEVLASIGSVDMRVRPLPLLQGRVQIEHLVLRKAEMRALLPGDGPARWPVAPEALGGSVQVEGLSLSDGSLALERPDGSITRLTGLSGEMGAGGPDGPFELMANGGLGGMPVRLALNAARRTANGGTPVRALLTLPDARTDLRFTGILPAGGVPWKLEGDIVLQGGGAAPLLRLARHLAGQEVGEVTDTGPALALRSHLAITPEAIGLDGIELQWGDSRATGSIDLPRMAAGEGAVVLAFTALDLDGLAADLPDMRPWLPDTPLTLDLLADQGRLNGEILRDLRLVGRLEAGVMNDAEMAATLPGATALTVKGSVDLTGSTPVADVLLDTRSDNLRAILTWSGVPVETVPAERLRQARLTGRLAGKPQDFALTDIAGSVDTTAFTGAFTLARRDRLGLGLRLTLDRLDLDAYRMADAPPPWTGLRTVMEGMDLTLEGRADLLTVDRIPVEGLTLDAGWTGNALSLRALNADAVAGINARASGFLSGNQGESSHLTLTANGPSLAPLLRALGRPDPVLAERLGSVAVEARLVGDMVRLAADIRADALGGSTHVGGTITDPLDREEAGPGLDLKVRSTLPETGNLLRLFFSDWRPAGPAGPLDIYASVAGPLAGPVTIDAIQGRFAGQEVAGALNWSRSAGEEPQPGRLSGELALGALDADLLLPGLTRDGAAWNLDWTRRINGEIIFAARQLTLGGEKLEQVRLPLTAGAGLIRLEEATAQWRGGTVKAGGAIEQTAADPVNAETQTSPLAGNLTLEVAGADLPPWLNGESLGVEGGKLDLSFTGTGTGPTPHAVTSSLSGSGQATLHGSTVTGIDLAATGKRLAEGGARGPANLRAILRRGGQTGFDTLSLSFALADRIAAISGIDAAGPQGALTGAGRWSWHDRTLDLALTARPADPKAAPSMGIRLAGPDQAAVRTLDLEAADAWLGRREAERRAREAAKEAATKPAPAAPTPAPKPAPKPAAPAPQPAQPQDDAVQGILDRLKRTP
ncbi:AsmA family protein [Niveispirillum fermenti]|uniref:AsmA family protein n=1 Tax=Niveispirillum fermenti TaxID=1233113 RepID=UPI003A8A8C26